MDAVDICLLCFVRPADYDPVEVLGLDTQDATSRQNCVIDFGEAAVGAGQNKVVQYVFATPGQRRSNPETSDRTGYIERHVIGN